MMKKAMFTFHLAKLCPGSLGNEFYLAQRHEKYPGVVSEMESFFQLHRIDNVEVYTKPQFKKLMKNILWEKNRQDVLNMLKDSKKISYELCCKDEYKMQDFFHDMNVGDARVAYKMLTFSLQTINLNCKSDKQYKSDGWICDDCRKPASELSEEEKNSPRIAYSLAMVTAGNVAQPGGFLDSQEHILLHCEANNHIRGEKNMDILQNCVNLFKCVIDRRMKRKKA